MNSGNINVGKYSLDARKATEEERKWIKDMYRSIKINSDLAFNNLNYYRFENFVYRDDDSSIHNDYPLITIQELRNRYYGNQIYELW